MTITKIDATEILDSRGEPTIEVTMFCNDISSTFGVPAGASTGKKEAHELRDGGERYGGKGVKKAIARIAEITPKLIGFELFNQSKFDQLLIDLDGTPNKSKLGGNSIVGLSLAYTQLSAAVKKVPLWQYLSSSYGTTPGFPRLFANLVNGGKHAPGLDIQEFMIVTKTTVIVAGIERIQKFRRLLKAEVAEAFGSGAELVGDEGGFAPTGAKAEQILKIFHSINAEVSNSFDIAIDAAASSFYNDGKYKFENNELTSNQLLDLYLSCSSKYGMVSVEDPFAEDDIRAWEELAKTKHGFRVIGDDLTVTNATLTDKFAKSGLIDGVIIKPNQIGTLTETINTIKTANDNNINVIVSHRSGETTSSFISDLAYAVGAYGIKIGAPVRGERVAKYDRFLEIVKEIQ